MSLDARFTELRSSSDRSRGGPVNPRFQRTHSPRERVSSLKNRLLAMEMAERPNVMAALSRGRARMGRGSFMGPVGGFMGGGGMRRARSPFPRSRSRQRNGSLGRSNSVGRLTRSQSMQSLMSISSDNGFEMMGGRMGRPGRGGRGGGGFRTRVFTRGSRIGARGGIQKLNMDLVANSRKRRSASLSRLGGSNVGVIIGYRRGGRGGRGIPAGGAGVKARLGVRPGGLTRSNSLTNLVPRGGGRGIGRGGSRGRGVVRGNMRQRSNSISRRGGGNLSARVGNLNGRGGNLNARGGNLTTRGGRGQSGIRGSARGNKGIRQQNGGTRGGFRGRGTRGGAGITRGRGGNRGRGVARGGRGGTKTPPKKEDLDNELDQYMSKTKSFLDKQLDQYMAQPAATA